jgi:hypothetical protein
MKFTYIFFYCAGGLILLIALLGNSLSKPLFDSISEKTLEVSGFKKTYFQSVDDKIDDLVYRAKQIELQIEKIKKFFSSDKVDENLYKKEKSEIMEKTFYDPLVKMFNYVYRLGFALMSFIFFCFALVFHLTYRSFDLRRRVRDLENRLNRLTA